MTIVFNSFYKYAAQVLDFTTTGAVIMKGVGIAMGALLSFIMPIQDFLLLIIAFVVIDLYTGWRKSVYDRKKRGVKMSAFRSFESKGLGKTLEKLMMYLVLMLVCQMFDWKYALSGLHSLSWYIGGLILVREVKSIFENADSVLESRFVIRLHEILNKITNK